jgi:glycosyltransferase involved in cell wall biosynthesis
MAKRENHEVFVAIPAASSVVECDLVTGLFQEIAAFAERRWGFALQFAMGNNGIHMARNFLVRRFLDTDCTDLFFIDSDIAWEPGAIVRMVEHPVDFVLGLYRLKDPREGYTYFADTHQHVRDPETGLIPINGGPAGFMRLRRSVIERMVDKLPSADEGGWMAEPMRPDYALPTIFSFNARRDPRTGQVCQAGEDMDFCLRWGEMGEQVWLDPDLTLHHIGKAKYSSNFWRSYTTKRQVVHGREADEYYNPPSGVGTVGNGDLEKFEAITREASP